MSREQAAALANDVTKKANELLSTFEVQLQHLSEALRHANSWISHAEREFSERAYAPYWAAIEAATDNLIAAEAATTALRTNTRKYLTLLRDKNHNFPLPPITVPIPNPEGTINTFRRVLRKGQTDFRFAEIGEQRATRRANMAGFESIAQGLTFNAARASEDLACLGEELSADLRGIAEHQRESLEVLESQDQKLDKMQHNHKP